MELLVTACAVFRILLVWSGLLAMLLNKSRKIQWDPSMLIAFPEPFLLAATLYWVIENDIFNRPAQSSQIQIMVGVCLGIASVALFFWSFFAYRRVGTGHYVDNEHRVITSGPYGLVRHPFYTSAFLCWAGWACATGSLAISALLAFYVIPAYWFYAKSEEEMMTKALGNDYETYRKTVPMFVPNLFFKQRSHT